MPAAQINPGTSGGQFKLGKRLALLAVLAVLHVAPGGCLAAAPDAAERTRFREAAKAAITARNYLEAETDYRAAWAASEGFGAKDPRWQESLRELGLYLLGSQKSEEAEQVFRQGLEGIQAGHREKYLEGGETMYYLGYVCFARGKYEEAEKLLLDARKVLGLQKGAFSTHVGFCMSALARVYTAQGKYSEAEPIFRKAIAIFASPKVSTEFLHVDMYSMNTLTTRFTPSPHVAAEERRLLALMYIRAGQFPQAEATCFDSMKFIAKNSGAESPDMAIAKVALAKAYLAEGKLDEADGTLKESMALFGKKYGPDSRQAAEALIAMAELDHLQHKDAEAEVCLRRGFDTLKFAASRPDKMFVMSVIYSNDGRMDEAESLLKLALDIEEAVLADVPLELAPFLFSAARADLERSKFAEAAARQKRGLGLVEKKLEANDPQLLPLLYEYQRTLQQLGRKADSDAVEARIKAIRARK